MFKPETDWSRFATPTQTVSLILTKFEADIAENGDPIPEEELDDIILEGRWFKNLEAFEERKSLAR